MEGHIGGQGEGGPIPKRGLEGRLVSRSLRARFSHKRGEVMLQESKIGSTKRQHSDKTKATALALLDANGGQLHKTARMLEIPLTTLYQWANGRGINSEVTLMRTNKKEELASKLDYVAHLAADLAPEKLETASYKDTMIGAGIAIDKAALLRGEPKQIHDQTDSYNAMAERVYKRALERGEDITLEAVKIRIVERKPEARRYLLPEGSE